jgi:hypothetical protein
MDKPTQFGLARAMQKRIEDILGRRAAQTDASRCKSRRTKKLTITRNARIDLMEEKVLI